MGVSFSAEFFFAAAALISFGTVVMCSLSLVRRPKIRACQAVGGAVCVQGRAARRGLSPRPSFYRFRQAGRRIACGCEKAARMEVGAAWISGSTNRCSKSICRWCTDYISTWPPTDASGSKPPETSSISLLFNSCMAFTSVFKIKTNKPHRGLTEVFPFASRQILRLRLLNRRLSFPVSARPILLQFRCHLILA